jgi:hypothetical protein
VAPLLTERDAALAKLKLPCGSCHPCLNWADETWRREGRKPPTVQAWEDALAERDAALAVIAKAAKDIRELAELYLYDGDTDRAVNDGYGALLCLAGDVARVRLAAAAPKEPTP